jgi:drug/metabolite transporter (DMT)-like permease
MTRRGLILFVLLGVAWGIPYLLIKIAVGQLTPAMLVFSRTALAAVVLLPVAAVRGELRPVLRRSRPARCSSSWSATRSGRRSSPDGCPSCPASGLRHSG